MIRNPYDIYGVRPVDKKCLEEEMIYCSLNYSDVNPYHYHPGTVDYIPASLLSSIAAGDGASSSPRQYIDPWDLENYAYLQRRSSETDNTAAVYSSDCESTASSQFYYKRGSDKQQQPGQDYYEHRQNYVDYGSTTNCDGSCRNDFIYSPASEYKRLREPQLQFPPPPSPPYEYDPYDLDSDAQTLMECQECSLSFDSEKKLYSSQSELEAFPYGTRTTTRTRTPPRHFSLSKKGLLQIDYSFNWNCLDINYTKMR